MQFGRDLLNHLKHPLVFLIPVDFRLLHRKRSTRCNARNFNRFHGISCTGNERIREKYITKNVAKEEQLRVPLILLRTIYDVSFSTLKRLDELLRQNFI
jgi:hypothetical protein